MATPLVRRPDSGGDSPMATLGATAAAEYLRPADGRGIAAQATAALSLLTGLWVALSPVFLTLQYGGANANVADVIAARPPISMPERTPYGQQAGDHRGPPGGESRG